VVWAVLLGASMVLAALLVSLITSSRVKADASYPSVSWWVLFLSVATYGIGALVAWATNWAP